MAACTSFLLCLCACLCAFGVTAEDDEKNTAFNEWFETLLPSDSVETKRPNQVEIRSTPGMGRGVFARTDLKEGDVLLEIPLNMIVCLQTVKASKFGGIYSKFASSTDKLTFFILQQRSDPASPFKSWLDVMPTSFASPVFFTEEQLKWLEGDELLDEVRKAQARYHMDHEGGMRIAKKHPEAFPEGCCSFELYSWARHMIESRAWHLRGDQYLAPMADFFNHEPHPSQTYDSEPEVRGDFFLAHHKVLGNRVKVISDRDCAKDAQVFETYGDNDNKIYFNYHGFVPDQNPYDCVRIQLPALKKDNHDSPASYKQRIGMLTALGIKSPFQCVRDQQLHHDRIVAFMRLNNMRGKEVEACTRKHKGQPMTQALVEECTKGSGSTESVFASLTRSIKDQLGKYPTTQAQDLERLKATKQWGEIWSLKYLANRKRILKKILEAINAQIVPGNPKQSRKNPKQSRKRKRKRKRKRTKEL